MSESTPSGVTPLAPTFSAVAPAQPQPRKLEIRFTGSGSEYFRIWIVNLLLTLVTLTLYYPWAKVRRLRYFYANTLIDGQPLDFHADPWKILRGYLLIGFMLALYSIAGRLSATAGLISFAILAALWPALLKSSMQFRLANTSWRGLRFRFRGTLGGAYKALLPWFIPGLLFLAPLLAVSDRNNPPIWYGGLMIVVGLGMLLVVPLLWWNLKKYQHDNFVYGALQTELKTGPGSFYLVFLKTFGVALLTMLVIIAVISAVGAAALIGGVRREGVGAAIFIGILSFFIGVLAVQIVPRPYFGSRMQNLLWSRTGNRSMHFDSALRFLPLLGLTLKNWLLVLLTLGLYWPFAAVAMARIKLEAMSVTTRIDLQTLADQARAAEGDAAGDAAGDLFGLDIGF
jgi:uncharacterized membrane protein YjgN (DUF898 family)